MTASPETQTGAYKKRGPVHMMITHRPDEKSYNVISFHAGYPFSDGSEIHMDVALKKGVETFSLFTKIKPPGPRIPPLTLPSPAI